MVFPEGSGPAGRQQASRSFGRLFPSKKHAGGEPQAPVQAPGDAIVPTHEPKLSLFVQQAVLGGGGPTNASSVRGGQQKQSFSSLARTLLEAPDRLKNDKAFKAKAFHAILQSLYLYEYVPSDVVTRLLPCLDTLDSKQDAKLYRMLLYLVRKDVSRGHAGTPTIVEHSGTTFAPDTAALKEEVAWALAGLAIDDEGDVRFHHLKLVYDEDAKPQFVVMIMDVVAGPATAKMKTGGVFAKRAHKRAASAFTVKWGKVDPAREAQPEPGTSSRARPAGLWAPPEETKETKETKEMKPTEETKETKETESQRVNVGATKKDVDTTTTTTIKAVYGCEDRDAILVPKPAPIITIRQSPAWPDVGELTAGTTLHAWGPNRSWHH